MAHTAVHKIEWFTRDPETGEETMHIILPGEDFPDDVPGAKDIISAGLSVVPTKDYEKLIAKQAVDARRAELKAELKSLEDPTD